MPVPIRLIIKVICVIIFFALIGVPFAINLLFKADTNINVFQAEKVDATASSISRLFITASAQLTCLTLNDMNKYPPA